MTRSLVADTIDAAAAIGREDGRANLRPLPDPWAIRAAAQTRAGHPTSTRHPDTYGYCVLDDAEDAIAAAYRTAYAAAREDAPR